MQKLIFVAFVAVELTLFVFAHPAEHENNIVRTKDLDTAETFWNPFTTKKRGYSGWGTGGVQPSNGYGAYGAGSYGNGHGFGYGNGYGNYGQYGQYGNHGYYGNEYYNKAPLYTGYVSQQPTYENYAIHGGHGFGKYGKY